MSDKRKPALKITAVICGKVKKKRVKVELFPAEQFPRLFNDRQHGRYRVRINGKWAAGEHSHTISNVISQLRQFLTKNKNG